MEKVKFTFQGSTIAMRSVIVIGKKGVEGTRMERKKEHNSLCYIGNDFDKKGHFSNFRHEHKKSFDVTAK